MAEKANLEPTVPEGSIAKDQPGSSPRVSRLRRLPHSQLSFGRGPSSAPLYQKFGMTCVVQTATASPTVPFAMSRQTRPAVSPSTDHPGKGQLS